MLIKNKDKLDLKGKQDLKLFCFFITGLKDHKDPPEFRTSLGYSIDEVREFFRNKVEVIGHDKGPIGIEVLGEIAVKEILKAVNDPPRPLPREVRNSGGSL